MRVVGRGQDLINEEFSYLSRTPCIHHVRQVNQPAEHRVKTRARARAFCRGTRARAGTRAGEVYERGCVKDESENEKVSPFRKCM